MPMESAMPEPPAAAHGSTQPAMPQDDAAVLEARGLSVSFSGKPAVIDVSLAIRAKRATALIGPSGCGKSTLLRHFNRLNEMLAGMQATGQVLFHGADLYDPKLNPVEVRRRIGMVFQKPNPFPASVYENVAWGPRLNRTVPENELADLVERSLRRANLWDEVCDRLADGALSLSGGQQQRLCIARAIAMQPEVILMDEPCSALDPAAAAAIEDLIVELKQRYTIVIASHDAREAVRVADYFAVMKAGRLIDSGEAADVFQRLESRILSRDD